MVGSNVGYTGTILFNPSAAETGIFRLGSFIPCLLNTWYARQSPKIELTMQDKWAIVLHENGFHVPDWKGHYDKGWKSVVRNRLHTVAQTHYPIVLSAMNKDNTSCNEPFPLVEPICRRPWFQVMDRWANIVNGNIYAYIGTFISFTIYHYSWPSNTIWRHRSGSWLT